MTSLVICSIRRGISWLSRTDSVSAVSLRLRLSLLHFEISEGDHDTRVIPLRRVASLCQGSSTSGHHSAYSSCHHPWEGTWEIAHRALGLDTRRYILASVQRLEVLHITHIVSYAVTAYICINLKRRVYCIKRVIRELDIQVAGWILFTNRHRMVSIGIWGCRNCSAPRGPLAHLSVLETSHQTLSGPPRPNLNIWVRSRVPPARET